jgi:hypothetical protein
MKTKLLKKVRKRYEIVRVDRLATDCCQWLDDMAELYGLPFFLIKDLSDDWRGRKAFGNFKDAQQGLINWIKSDYREQFKHKPTIQVKVWHV